MSDTVANPALAESLWEESKTRRTDKSGSRDDAIQLVAERLLRFGAPKEITPSYVSKAIRNAAIDIGRAETTRSNYEQQFAEVSEQSTSVSPERIVAGRQAVTALIEAVSALPVLTQEIFWLYHVDGKTQKEIADHFKLSLSTVEKRLAVAKGHCRSHMSPHI